jgi:hypothetical protein
VNSVLNLVFFTTHLVISLVPPDPKEKESWWKISCELISYVTACSETSGYFQQKIATTSVADPCNTKAAGRQLATSSGHKL